MFYTTLDHLFRSFLSLRLFLLWLLSLVVIGWLGVVFLRPHPRVVTFPLCARGNWSGMHLYGWPGFRQGLWRKDDFIPLGESLLTRLGQGPANCTGGKPISAVVSVDCSVALDPVELQRDSEIHQLGEVTRESLVTRIVEAVANLQPPTKEIEYRAKDVYRIGKDKYGRESPSPLSSLSLLENNRQRPVYP